MTVRPDSAARHSVAIGGPPSPASVWTAMWLVYVIWGSTYLGIAVLAQGSPPLLGMGLRFVTAAAVLALVLAVRRGPRHLHVPLHELGSSALVGFLLLGVGIGILTLAERYVPSGVAALIVAIVPLWVVLLRLGSGDRPSPVTWLGVAVGLAGMAVLVLPGGDVQTLGGATTAQRTLWSLAIVAGSLSWAIGSFAQPRLPTPGDPLVLTTYEMLGGGLVLLVVGLAGGERLDLGAVTPAAGWAFVYLVAVGSLVGYVAYVWLLGHAPLSLVSTYAYVNPVIAVLLGVLFHGEHLTGTVLLGGAIIVAGVILVVSAERLNR